jgi:hypothetical protein
VKTNNLTPKPKKLMQTAHKLFSNEAFSQYILASIDITPRARCHSLMCMQYGLITGKQLQV